MAEVPLRLRDLVLDVRPASARKLRSVLASMEKLADQLPRYGQRVEQILHQTGQITAKLADAST